MKSSKAVRGTINRPQSAARALVPVKNETFNSYGEKFASIWRDHHGNQHGVLLFRGMVWDHMQLYYQVMIYLLLYHFLQSWEYGIHRRQLDGHTHLLLSSSNPDWQKIFCSHPIPATKDMVYKTTHQSRDSRNWVQNMAKINHNPK